MNLHWIPLANAWLVSPDSAQQPRRLIDFPSTCVADSTWKWGVVDVLAGDGDPPDDLVFRQ